MPAWRYRIPPDLNFTIRTAGAEPKLLSRAFGPVVEAGDEAGDVSLVLDLAARDSTGAGIHSVAGEGRTATRGVYKAVPWSCSIARTEEDSWTIAFRSLVMREYLAMHIALLPAVRVLLTERNNALILGAAYESEGRAIVLTGPTGTGKTSLLMAALGRGARFIGDEYLGLNSTGQASPIVRSLALRRSSLDLVPVAADRLTVSRRLALRVAELAASLTRRRLEPLSHVRPEEVGMKVTDGPVPVKHLVWLEQMDDGTAATVRPMPGEDVVRELSLRQAVHQRAYGDITLVLESAFGRTDTESNWCQALSDSLANVECHRMRFSPNRVSDAFDSLEQLGQQ